MTPAVCDAVIIGAGPYGIAAAAHLRAAGVETRSFGRAMDFWEEHMPAGMFLRSHRDASHIAHPQGAMRLDEFEAVRGAPISQPTPLEDFIPYGRWFQRSVVPDLDARRVRRVEPGPRGFRVVLEDGEPVETRRVVVAAGILPFTRRPPEFDRLPAELCSHSSDHSDLSPFAGRRVAVVGGGQSALECAVLLLEAGADVEVIIRAEGVRWLGRPQWLGPLRTLLYPPTDIGPPFPG